MELGWSPIEEKTSPPRKEESYKRSMAPLCWYWKNYLSRIFFYRWVAILFGGGGGGGAREEPDKEDEEDIGAFEEEEDDDGGGGGGARRFGIEGGAVKDRTGERLVLVGWEVIRALSTIIEEGWWSFKIIGVDEDDDEKDVERVGKLDPVLFPLR
jgi:hypothetical protein